VIERFWLSEKVEEAAPETIQKIEEKIHDIEEVAQEKLHDLTERFHRTATPNREENDDEPQNETSKAAKK
jgi:predicted RNA-binding protein